jgi:DNA-binding CsgD family transcriptional regulator
VASRSVVAFVARQLSGRIGILLTGRADAGEPDPAAWLQLRTPNAVNRLRVGPLSLSALHTMIVERFGKALPRPTMVRIAEVSGGNPFYALELARTVESRSSSADPVLPSTLADLVKLRVAHFDREVSDMLLAACSVTDASVDLLADATGVSAERVMELLEAPAREGVIRIDGGDHVVFAHPLLARGIYTHAGPARRRRMHRALAAVEAQPELKARHMALGAASAEPDTLKALDEAAAAAVVRGSAAAAADLYELAIGLGGDTPLRRLSAAEQHLRAGETRRAKDILESAVADFAPGPSRAAALILLGATRMSEHDYAGALPLLAEAICQADGDPSLLVRGQLWLSRALTMTGRHDAARTQAKLAVASAESLGSPKLISQSLAYHVLLRCADGHDRDEAALQRALEVEPPDPDVAAPFRASVTDAVTLAWTGRLDEALMGLIAARRRCVEMGSDADLVYVSGHLSMVYVWLGRYSVAADVAQDMLTRGRHLGGGFPTVAARTQRAKASSFLGRERAARDDARAAIAGAQQCGAPYLAAAPLMTLGFLDVSLGHYAKALNVLRPLLVGEMTAVGRGTILAPYVPDAVEAMAALGRLDEATPLVEMLERKGAEFGAPWTAEVGARCRSMLLAAHGELAAAEEMLQGALVTHDGLAMPFERARTQLLMGQVLRRQRRKSAAASTLREAYDTFEQLGTPLWAERARVELERTDAPRRKHSELTSSELRVARLATSGLTNKGIASALFISPKTVEHNLGSVYRKLSIRTRAELASRAAELGDE